MIFTIAVAVVLFIALPSECQLPYQRAVVDIVPGSSRSVRGQLVISAHSSGIEIKGEISGLTPGLHGFHVHQKGELGNTCKDAGGHFNPFQHPHGKPDDLRRHVGDLGNIYADQRGNAKISIIDDRGSLNPKSAAYIGNRAIVVHAKADDLGRGNNEESLKTGNAGSRVACGVIRVEVQPKQLIPEPQRPSPLFERPKTYQIILPSGNIGSFDQQPLFFNQQTYFGAQISGPPQFQKSAIVKIIPGASNSVKGELTVHEVDGGVVIKGFITGLKPGLHGFHIHVKGDLGNKCANALGHFNPFNLKHGAPKAEHRHVGDLGNVVADYEGTATIDIFDPQASLDPSSNAFIGGRAMVVHANADDLGRGGDQESLVTGNAGPRVGCGVIVTSSPPAGFHRQQQQFRQIPFPSFFPGNFHRQQQQMRQIPFPLIPSGNTHRSYSWQRVSHPGIWY